MEVDVKLEHSLLAVESEHELYGMVELRAPEPAANAERLPLRVALILDRSGSRQIVRSCASASTPSSRVARLADNDSFAADLRRKRADLQRTHDELESGRYAASSSKRLWHRQREMHTRQRDFSSRSGEPGETQPGSGDSEDGRE